MEWIDPWEVLGLDVGADHDAVVAAHRRFAREHHPDRFAEATEVERAAAADRMARANYAYELLTDRDAAKAHRRRFMQLKAKGHAPEAPARPARRVPPPPPSRRASASPSGPIADGPPDARQRAAGEFPPANRGQGTPWTARGRRRGRFRRR